MGRKRSKQTQSDGIGKSISWAWRRIGTLSVPGPSFFWSHCVTIHLVGWKPRSAPRPSVSISLLVPAAPSSDGHMTLPDLHAAMLQPITQILKKHQDGSGSLPVSSEHIHILLASNDVTLLTAVSGSEIMRPGKKKMFWLKTNAAQAQCDRLEPSESFLYWCESEV